MKINRNPKTIHLPLASCSHQIELQDSQRLLVMPGQIGMDRGGTLPIDPIEQIKVASANVEQRMSVLHKSRKRRKYRKSAYITISKARRI